MKKTWVKKSVNSFSLFFLMLIVAASSVWADSKTALSVNWKGRLESKKLAEWSYEKILSSKKVASRWEAPRPGRKSVLWKGIPLNDLVDEALDQLSLQERATVDLVILMTKSGEQVQVPRSFIRKFPVLLSIEKDRKVLSGEDGPYATVVPWTSFPKMKNELLPVQNYFVKQVTEITLTRYRLKYPEVFLRRRRSPLALRGEKVFVRNCLGCHNGSLSPRKKPEFAGHSSVSGFPKLDRLDHRGIQSYYKAFEKEN